MSDVLTGDWTPRIGLFDSGIGGLTVLRHVLSACPGVPCLYVGDLKHVPYGPRTLTEIHQIAEEIITWLIQQGCTHIAVACNTSTAALKDNPLMCPVPLVNVIDPLRDWLLAHPELTRVGVVANPVTAKRAIHAQVLEEVRPLHVTTNAAPTLVSLLESLSPAEDIDAAVAEAIAPLLADRVEACLYGCTHYPLAMAAFRRALGAGIPLIDSGALVAQALADQMPVGPAGSQPGPVEFVTTAPSDDFARWVEQLMPPTLSWTLRTCDFFEQSASVLAQ
ncbi:MAG: Glutamate racemase [bacterium]|nr:Glutamate racemase [bacterium]